MVAYPTEDERVDLACDWSDFRADYGVSADPRIMAIEYRAFSAGWWAGKRAEGRGILR